MHPIKGCIRLLLFSVCLKWVVFNFEKMLTKHYTFIFYYFRILYFFIFTKKKVRTSAHLVRLKYDQAPANNKKSQRNIPLSGIYSLCFFSVCFEFGRFQSRDSTINTLFSDKYLSFTTKVIE